MSFQTQVGANMSPGIEGAFCTANPLYSTVAGPNGLVSGLSKDANGNLVGGAMVGRFAWLNNRVTDADGAPASVDNFGAGAPAGLIHNEQQGLITVYLAEASLVVPTGFPITVLDVCELWVKNRGSTVAQYGQKCYASFSDGGASFAAAGAPGTASSSAASIAAATFSVTGTIAGNLMTVTAVGSGTVVPGATVSGTSVISGTKVSAQVLPLLAGEALGGIGRYTVDTNGQSVASTTISGTYGTLTVGGTVAGSFGVGDTLTGTDVVSGTKITALGTGTGGAGTYIVDNNTVVGSTAITANTNFETKWVARSVGAPGELVKVSPIQQ